jgi:hypothetical protein
MKQINECPFNVLIKFNTIVGCLIGKRVLIKFSNGYETSFFVSSEVKENKHWATFTEKEVYDFEIINIENLALEQFENVGDEGLFPNYSDKDIWMDGFISALKQSI